MFWTTSDAIPQNDTGEQSATQSLLRRAGFPLGSSSLFRAFSSGNSLPDRPGSRSRLSPFSTITTKLNHKHFKHRRKRHQNCSMFHVHCSLPKALLLRKEVIQPHLPIRLPCYDFTPIANPTFGHALLAVRLWTSGITGSHGVTGGVYKARERIHRGMLIRDY